MPEKKSAVEKRWGNLMNELRDKGLDFFTDDGVTTINIFLNDTGYNLKLKKDGSWDIE